MLALATKFRRNLLKIKKLSQESLWVAGGQAASVLGAIAIIKVLTTYLSPPEFGRFALALTYSTLLEQLVFAPLSNGISRFYPAAKSENALSIFLPQSLQLSLKASASTLGISAAVSAILLVQGHRELLGFILVATLYSLLSGYNSIVINIYNIDRARRAAAVSQACTAWSRFTFLLVILQQGTPTALSAFTAQVAASVLIVTVQLALFPYRERVRSTIKRRKTNDWIGPMLKYSWPFAIWGTFQWLGVASDRWALKIFTDNHQVGKYTALYQLGFYPMTLLATFMIQLISPITFMQSSQNTGDKADRTTRLVALATLTATILAFLLSFPAHAWIFRLFIGAQYHDASWILPWIVLSGGLFATGQSLSLVFMNNLQPRRLLGPKILTAIIAVSLNFAGAWRFGLPGVAASSVATSSVYFLLVYRLLPMRQPTTDKPLFNSKKIAAHSKTN